MKKSILVSLGVLSLLSCSDLLRAGALCVEKTDLGKSDFIFQIKPASKTSSHCGEGEREMEMKREKGIFFLLPLQGASPHVTAETNPYKSEKVWPKIDVKD